jgi:hypothetical protein
MLAPSRLRSTVLHHLPSASLAFSRHPCTNRLLPRLRFTRSQSTMTQIYSTTDSGPTKVAVCQITSTNDVQYNLKISSDVIRQAAAAGAKVSLLHHLTVLSILGPFNQTLPAAYRLSSYRKQQISFPLPSMNVTYSLNN